MTPYIKLVIPFIAASLMCCGQDSITLSNPVTVRFDSIYFKKLLSLQNEADSIFNLTHDSSIIKSEPYYYLIPHKTKWDVGEFTSTTYKFQLDIMPVGWVNDFEFILSKQEEIKLNLILHKYESETSNELSIITIDKSWVDGDNFNSLILDIHNKWGVGKKGKNNGILIGVCTGLRKIRINNGYGIEPILSNEETKKIIDEIILPKFKEGKYYEGLEKGIAAIISKVR